jgi:hypothetical protein
MKTQYKYIEFLQSAIDDGVWWLCQNHKTKDCLGTVEWYSDWNRFCYFPKEDTLYSTDCN